MSEVSTLQETIIAVQKQLELHIENQRLQQIINDSERKQEQGKIKTLKRELKEAHLRISSLTEATRKLAVIIEESLGEKSEPPVGIEEQEEKEEEERKEEEAELQIQPEAEEIYNIIQEER